MRNYKIFVLSLIATGALVGGIRAQNRTAEIDKIFGWAKPSEPGCAVAVSQNGKLVVNKAYGSADLERSVPITPDTLFDAGSIRKQFVAAAILILAEEGKLSISDDVRKYIPRLPDYGHKITIDHLMTHTSGIRDWQPLLNFAGGDPDAMTMILRQRELNFVPGEEWSYSNSGYVLLPEIIERVSGTSFPEFVRKRFFEPLGMKSTIYVMDPLYLIKNRALGYSKDAKGWKMDMYVGNDRGGAGALFTTAADLVTWNDALMANRLGEFVIQKLQEPTTLKNGRKLSYARGLTLEPAQGGGQLVLSSGGAAGYSARAAYFKKHGLSFGMMCNLDGGARGVLAGRTLDLFLPAGIVNEEPSVRPDINVGDLNARAGLFFNEQTGEPLRFAVNNNTLMVPGAGPLIPIGPESFRIQTVTPFFMSGADAEFRFVSANQLEMKTNEGPVTKFRRAAGYTPTTDELNAYAGRFHSDELMSAFEAIAGKDSLTVRVNGSPRAVLEFRLAERDVFHAGASLIRFRRDSSGRVVGLEYSNPLLRSVKFTRGNGR